MIFDHKKFDEIDDQKINIFLLKLHGSLDWKFDKNTNQIIILSEIKDDPKILRICSYIQHCILKKGKKNHLSP